MKINLTLLVAIAEQKKQAAALVEGPRLALFAPMPEYEPAKKPVEQERGVWEC